MKILIAIFIGGGLGSIARYGIYNLVRGGFNIINPLGVLTANIISTIILGVVLFYSTDKFVLSDTFKAMIIVGFCGGFSTFSTFSFETFELLRTGNYLYAVANVLVSVILGLLVLFILSKSL